MLSLWRADTVTQVGVIYTEMAKRIELVFGMAA